MKNIKVLALILAAILALLAFASCGGISMPTGIGDLIPSEVVPSIDIESLLSELVDPTVTVVNDGMTDEKYATKLEELSTLSKVVSSVRYNGILPNTDVEYILSGNDLKENIIINDVSEEYIYTFELSLNNLTASLDDDGSIEFLDNNTVNLILKWGA